MTGLTGIFAEANSSAEQSVDIAYFSLLLLLFGVISLCVLTFYFVWQYREKIGVTLRQAPPLHFLLFAFTLLVGGVAGLCLEGVNPERLMAGRATTQEMSILMALGAAALVGCATACITWTEGVVAAQETSQLSKRADTAERDARFANAINHFFLGVVSRKTSRFVNGTGIVTADVLDHLRVSHNPHDQIDEMLRAVWQILWLHIGEKDNGSYSLRIALFKVEGDILKVERSWTGGTWDTVQGPKRENCRGHYATNNSRASLAVQAAFSRHILIEPNTTAGVTLLRTAYRPFADTHYHIIKSIFAAPLGMSVDSDKPSERVLCVDTDVLDGFTDSDLKRLECIRINFEQRLLIELGQAATFDSQQTAGTLPH